MIVIGGQIEGLVSRKDRTMRVSIGTQELNPNDASELFMMNQQFCYIAIKPEPFTSDEKVMIDGLKTDLENNKTPSQRLRNILYVLFEQNNEGYKDFSTYYVTKIEQICVHFKTKLD